MADRVFSIDLGSAYTKIALRADPTADAQLINPARAGSVGGDVAFWVPTVVAVQRRSGNTPVLEFGEQAANRTTAGDFTVYRNWKKSVFLRPPSGDGHHSPLEALLASGEMTDLAAKFNVTPAQLGYLRQMAAAARGMLGIPGRAMSQESFEHKNAVALAAHYFKWLRDQVLAACDRLRGTGLKYEAIPVRLSVPAFAHGKGVETHPGCTALLDSLTRAGWPLHPEQPLVTEPYANAIGILTKGKNCVVRKGTINLGGMFALGPLMTVLRDPVHHPTYRALVIDVGAFTTDFAGIEITPPDDKVSDIDSALTITQHSVPVGASDLDAHVAAALGGEKGRFVFSLPQYDQEMFRRLVYAEGKPYATNVHGRIGAGAEGDAIRDALQTFGRQLGAAVAEFCDGRPPANMQELILSGGGAAIPAVRDALQLAALAGGHKYVRTHAPALRKTAGGPPVAKLDQELSRGGSAVGGASLYFEREYQAVA